MQRVVTLFNSHLDSLVDHMHERVVNEQVEPYSSLAPGQLRSMIANVVKAFGEDIDKEVPTVFPAYWEAIAHSRAEQGVSVTTLLYIMDLGNAVLNTFMMQALADDPAAQVLWSQQIYKITYHGVVALSRTFITAHAAIIREQATQIRALATPIVPVYTGILVLPLVGDINTSRANQIMENLLAEIVAMQADVVLIDVTGVPLIDTGVANYMLQMARATQLLGAQVVLVGISAEIAQTMVQLGVDMQSIQTRSNLQAGIEYALRMQGQAIQPIAAANSRQYPVGSLL